MMADHAADANGHAHGPLIRLRGYLLAGVLVTAPLGITLYLTYHVLAFIDREVAALLPAAWYDSLAGGTAFPGLGIALALVFFIIMGWLATNFLGRFFIRVSERVLDRLPVIRGLYGGMRQIFETVMAKQSEVFRDVVVVRFPSQEMFSIGFVTGRTKGEIQRLTDDEVINVFVPTTPNPTSGYLLFVPKRDVIFLSMTAEEGLKLIVSGGIIVPPDPEGQTPVENAHAAR
ncbi:MAG TPA: hypothetical protein DDX54_06435 [Rhodospirillaceae bacterium]|nr:hypothetical protein [Rhodospirillaceae bacterium]